MEMLSPYPFSTPPIHVIPFPEWLSHIEQSQHFVYISGWQFAVMVHTDISCSPAIDTQLILGEFGKKRVLNAFIMALVSSARVLPAITTS